MKENDSQVVIITDLGFGDGGKGTITEFLTQQLNAHTIIRYNGGPQAGHNVMTPDGKFHTFAQFGSGMLREDVRTHLSRFMLVDPLAMLKEERHLQSIGITNAFPRTTIEEETIVITPFHQAVNRLKEITPEGNRHQSCGRGVKEAISDFSQFGEKVLFVKDLSSRLVSEKKLKFLRGLQIEKIRERRADLPKSETVTGELQVLDDPDMAHYSAELYQYFTTLTEVVDESYLKKILDKPGTVIFEGAQGVMIDVNFGFKPYTTWTDTTFNNAEMLLGEQGYEGQKVRLGVLRAYAHRHGAGPFVTEDPTLTAVLPDLHNKTNPWQGHFRVGYFDLLSSLYALEVVGKVDALAITHLDRLKDIPEWKICGAYQYEGSEDNLTDFFESENGLVKRIKVVKPPVISHQQKLTELLEKCLPEYSASLEYKDTVAYLSYIESKLQTPLVILSSGSTVQDKKLVNQILEGGPSNL